MDNFREVMIESGGRRREKEVIDFKLSGQESTSARDAQ